jgi:hypothetical protein
MSVLQSPPLKHVGMAGQDSAKPRQYFFQSSALVIRHSPDWAQHCAVAFP